MVIPIQCLQYKAKKTSKIRHTKLTLTFPCSDARDFSEGHYEANIIEEGTAIHFKLPVAPAFFLKFVNLVSKKKKAKGLANDQDKDAHQTMATSVLSKKSHTMEVVYELPGAMAVSNKCYNEDATGQKLIARIEGVGSTFKKITQSHFLVYFDMVVVGTEERIRAEDGGDEDVTAAFEGMSFEAEDDDNDSASDDEGRTTNQETTGHPQEGEY
jgi:hypothetical protein